MRASTSPSNRPPRPAWLALCLGAALALPGIAASGPDRAALADPGGSDLPGIQDQRDAPTAAPLLPIVELDLRQTAVGEDGELTAFVAGRGGPGIPALPFPPEQLRVEIDGHPAAGARVEAFGPSGQGITVLIGVDTSGTMRKAMPTLKDQLAGFTSTLRPGIDASALGTIGDDWILAQDFTRDPAVLAAALRALKADAQTTALFESVDLGLRTLKAAPPALPKRRFMIVVSDGLNEKAGRTADECVAAARAAGLQVHSLIYLATRTERYLAAKGDLEKISRDSGAQTLTVDEPGELGGALAALRASVEAERVVRLDTEAAELDPGPHTLTVRYGQVKAEASFTAPRHKAPPPPPAGLPPEAAAPEDRMWLPAAGGGIVLLLGAAVLLRRRKRAPEEALEPEPPPPEGPRLRVLSGPREGERLSLPPHGGTVGYDPASAVVLEDESVSGLHARFVPGADGALCLCDEGSTNGTFIDEVRVGRAPLPLRAGARLRFGLVVVSFEP